MKFKTVELRIEKRPDKNFFVCFEHDDKNICDLWNSAICEVLSEEGFRPFHQVGSHEGTGYMAWEVWVSTSKEELEKRFEAIHKKAKELFEILYNW